MKTSELVNTLQQAMQQVTEIEANQMQELKEFKEKQAAKNAKLKKDIISALDAFMSEDEVTAPVAEEKPVEAKETVSTPTMQEVIAAKAAEATAKAEAKKAADKLAADIAEAKELAAKAKAEQQAKAEELKARSAKALAEAEAKARAARAEEAKEAIAKATKNTAKKAQPVADGMTPERMQKLTALYDEPNPEFMVQAIEELKKEGEALAPCINENGWFTRSIADCTKIEKRTEEIVNPLVKELMDKGVTMDDLKYQRKLTFSKLRAKQMISFAQMYGMLPRSVEGLEPSEQKQHINQLIRQLMLNRLLNSESMEEWRGERGYASIAQIPDTDLAKAYTSIANNFMFDALYEETL